VVGAHQAESVACNLLKALQSPVPRATHAAEEFPMPFLALFGSLFGALFGALTNVVRWVVRGGAGETPALRPIPISERHDERRRR